MRWQDVAWPRVRRVAYRVRHHYRYTYSGPVTDMRQRLVMIPRALHADQRLLVYYLDVRGAGKRHTLEWETDAFGNRVCHVYAEQVAHAVDFEATYWVDRRADSADEETHGFPPACTTESLDEYLQFTALTAPDRWLKQAARDIASRVRSPLARVEWAHDWAARAIVYQIGVTGVQTPAAMALRLGKGVCQDYAHILLSVLRLMGIPARYVSGHLLGEGAPHAWVEALLEDPRAPGGVRVIAYDPTHARRAGLNYVTVAVGRDFQDVTMTSGFFSGSATGRLSASKRADIVELEYRADSEEVAA